MFKVGDTVKITKRINGHHLNVGDIMVIDKIIEEDNGTIDHIMEGWHLSEEEFELVDPLEVSEDFWSDLFDRSCKEEDIARLRETVAYMNLKAIVNERHSFLHLATAEGSEFWKYVFDRMQYFLTISEEK